MAKELRENIEIALRDFTTQPLRQAALGLFGVLGLKSQRSIGLDSLETLIQAAPLDARPKLEALRGKVSGLHALFQITTEEIRGMTSQTSLFGAGEWDRAKVESYITIALELSQANQTRSDLAKITRSLNQALGGMPALVLMKQGHHITLSVVQRRLNKRDQSRDVLEKITLIRGVDCRQPHRAHLEILADFALPQLTRDRSVTNFVQLERAWAEVLNAEKLNQKFYKELANWYFWACQHPGVKLPKDAGSSQIFFIRLITRLMFAWFLLEKELVPVEIFDQEKLKGILKNFDYSSAKNGDFYQAILQNLFFATLNTERNGEQSGGEPPPRRFKLNKSFQGKDEEHGIKQLYRYDELFNDAPRALDLFASVPFLNGGLFECLDKVAKESPNGKYFLADGFSSEIKNRAVVPNELFFGEERKVDLSDELEARNRHHSVKGLINIFRSYKFTVAENTPIEEEVALDPEMLGQVFENLLATYNPETQSTARKQTGSFYTPRNIVDYMVDESLIAYMYGELSREAPQPTGSNPQTDLLHAPDPKARLSPAGPNGEPDHLERRLRHLFSYTQEPHQFNPKEADDLVAAIERVKILDPACGSGAFPMGALQKLVFVLGKLDSENAQWKRRVIEREVAQLTERIRQDQSIARQISDREARKLAEDKLQERLGQIEAAFSEERADLDYGRKLFLLEYCIYGVDLQPIAVQIAKLRCFISLVVDQKDRPKLPNRGVLALPNLETKFVAANSLGQIKQSPSPELFGGDLERLKEQLREVRHKHFQARKYKEKDRWRKEDERIRDDIAKLLEKDHLIDADTARKLSKWNPYDQNSSAVYFDSEWMFGIPPKDAKGNPDGFDVVIGNPPYVRQEELKRFLPPEKTYKDYKDFLKATYPNFFTGTADLFVYFFKRSVEVLKPNGTLAFICSNKYFRSGYGEGLRKLLGEKTRIQSLIDFGDADVFTAIAYPSILITQNAKPDKNKMRVLDWGATRPIEPYENEKPVDTERRKLSKFVEIFTAEHFSMPQTALKPDGWRISQDTTLDLMSLINMSGKPLKDYLKVPIRFGVKTGFNEAFIISKETKDELLLHHSTSEQIIQPLVRGRDIKRWKPTFSEKYLILIESSANKSHPWSGKSPPEAEKVFAKTHPSIHKFMKQYQKALEDRSDKGHYYWELRSCDYWPELRGQKIVYPDIADKSNFAFDSGNFIAEATLFLIANQNTSLLSSLSNKFLGSWSARLDWGATYRGESLTRFRRKP